MKITVDLVGDPEQQQRPWVSELKNTGGAQGAAWSGWWDPRKVRSNLRGGGWGRGPHSEMWRRAQEDV